jgi:hypothetical protein
MYSHLMTPDHLLKRRAEVTAKKAALKREISLASFDCPTNVDVHATQEKKHARRGVRRANTPVLRIKRDAC